MTLWSVEPELHDAKGEEGVVHRMPDGAGELCVCRVACLRKDDGEDGHHYHQNGIDKVALMGEHA